MKVAVLVYGRLANAKKHYKNIIESLGLENNVDFYMSSDNSPEWQLQEFLEVYKPILYINHPVISTVDFNKYNPKRPEQTPETIHNMTCHFINKYRVLLLLEAYVEMQRIEYDVVVSLRVDLVFEEKFDFTSIQERHIYIPSGRDWVEKGVNDNIAYGTLAVMKRYNEIYVWGPLLLDNKMCMPHPEIMCLSNIQLHSLHLVRVNLAYIFDK